MFSQHKFSCHDVMVVGQAPNSQLFNITEILQNLSANIQTQRILHNSHNTVDLIQVALHLLIVDVRRHRLHNNPICLLHYPHRREYHNDGKQNRDEWIDERGLWLCIRMIDEFRNYQ